MFHTADPVSGTIGTFAGSSSIGIKESESEPLGQQIELTDPGTSAPTSYDQVLGMGKDPEWQCLKWEQFRIGTFRSMPVHCQKQAALNKDEFSEWYAINDDRNPQGITAPPAEPPDTSGGDGGGMPVNPTPTNKPTAETSQAGLIPAASLPSEDGCTWSDGRWDCVVQSEKASPEVPDFISAEHGGNLNFVPPPPPPTPQEKVNTAISDARTYLSNSKCSDFLNKLLGTKVNKKAKSPLDMLNKVDGKVYLLKLNPKDNMLAHAVLPNDYYNNPANHADGRNRKFSEGDTILVSWIFINNTRNNISFDKLEPQYRSSLTDREARAVAVIHEILHLYTGLGHDSAPETRDGLWNDYIYWVCLKGMDVEGF